MKQATVTGTGKYEALLERCRSLEPVPTAVAHPCEASALAGAIEAAQKKLIVPILVGHAAKIAETAKAAGLSLAGLEVIDALGRQSYDVVLMDVQMPEMDGLEATHYICQKWSTGERPRIIAMTANAMQGDRDKCVVVGMDDYISKPVNPLALQEVLKRWGQPTVKAMQRAS